jgi:hypothetical protein
MLQSKTGGFSMAEPDLRFIGERLTIVQADLRDKANKGDVARLSADIAHLKADVAELKADLHSRFASIDDRFFSIDAQFAQVHETMTANLAVLIAAIRGERT